MLTSQEFSKNDPTKLTAYQPSFLTYELTLRCILFECSLGEYFVSLSKIKTPQGRNCFTFLRLT
jgi:hypothetical protein